MCTLLDLYGNGGSFKELLVVLIPLYWTCLLLDPFEAMPALLCTPWTRTGKLAPERCFPTSAHPPFQPDPFLTCLLEWSLVFEAQQHIKSLLPRLLHHLCGQPAAAGGRKQSSAGSNRQCPFYPPMVVCGEESGMVSFWLFG